MARYLRLALKQRKMTRLWSPLAAEPFDFDMSEFHSRHNFFHPSYNDVGPVYKFRIELRLDFAPFGSREKFERPSDRK